jgi:hypothetical protein
MKHINDTFQRILLIILFAALAYIVVSPARACEIGQALNMETKQCEDINTSLDPKLKEFYNWNDEE